MIYILLLFFIVYLQNYLIKVFAQRIREGVFVAIGIRIWDWKANDRLLEIFLSSKLYHLMCIEKLVFSRIFDLRLVDDVNSELIRGIWLFDCD